MATLIMTDFTDQKVVSGLNSYQYTIPTAQIYKCRITVDHREASTITVSIVQAGSVNATLATITLPGSPANLGLPQGTAILQTAANCAVNDTITFSITSSDAIDQQLNTIKSRLICTVGGLN
jgi:hypothetical protein